MSTMVPHPAVASEATVRRLVDDLRAHLDTLPDHRNPRGRVYPLASLLAVAYGTRHEEARVRARRPGQLHRPRTPRPGPSRRFSLLRQGAACLRRLLARNRLWARVWLTPTPGPDRAGGLRCLSPHAA